MTTMTPLDLSRTLRERSKITHTQARHSPDGYFAHDDVLLRNWRPLTGLASTAPPNGSAMPAFIRRRSKGHLADADGMLQDVQEEDATAADRAHPWRRPSRHDSRSPCPALNAAANHGYLPRDGRDLSMWTIICGIRECYHVSWALAIVFTIGSFVILRWGGVGRGWLWPRIDLEDLAAHNVLEHNASLTHMDYGEHHAHSPTSSSGPRSRSVSSSSSTAISLTPPSSTGPPFPLSLLPAFIFHFFPYSFTPRSGPRSTSTNARIAPLRPSRTLIRALFADSASGTHLTLPDLARARIRRTATTGPCPPHLSHFSDAECGLAIAILGGEVHSDSPRVPLGVLREWLEDERLPAGWKPGGVMSLSQEHRNTVKIQALMANKRLYRARRDDVRTVVLE